MVTELKIVFIGAKSVGKTSLISRFSKNGFSSNYKPTTNFEFFIKNYTLDKNNMRITMWDRPSTEQSVASISSFYRNANAVVLVYDVTNKDSFLELQHWKKEILEFAQEGTPVIVVGNKIDIKEEHLVTTEEGQSFANDNGYIHCETSAKKKILTKSALYQIVSAASLFTPLQEAVIRSNTPLPQQTQHLLSHTTINQNSNTTNDDVKPTTLTPQNQYTYISDIADISSSATDQTLNEPQTAHNEQKDIKNVNPKRQIKSTIKEVIDNSLSDEEENSKSIKPSTFHFTSQSFFNFYLMKPCDFTFIVQEKEYYCPHEIAEFLSPLILTERVNDPTFNNFVIRTIDPGSSFEKILKILFAQEVSLTKADLDFFFSVSKEILNPELARLYLDQATIDQNNAVNIVYTGYLVNIETPEAICECARHIESLFMLIADLPYTCIEAILKSDEILVQSEDSFYDIIVYIIEKNSDSYMPLLLNIHPESLGEEKAAEFLKQCLKLVAMDSVGQEIKQITHLSEQIYQVLSRRFVPSNLTLIDSSKQRKYIPPLIYVKKIPFENDPNNGIFAFLKKLSKDINPVDSKYVEIQTMNNSDTPLKYLIDVQNKVSWGMKEINGNYIVFHFLKGKVALTAYSITSGPYNSYWQYPISFELLGSNDGENWETIDQKIENNDIGDHEKTFTWTIDQTTPFSFIKFTLINVVRVGYLYTSNFELFGKYEQVIEPIQLSDFSNV